MSDSAAPTDSPSRIAARFYARVLSYFTPDWPYIALTLTFILLSTLAALLQPFPLAILIDSVDGKQPSDHWAYWLFLWMTPESVLGKIIALAGITLGLRLLQELFSMGKALANIRVGYSGLMRARCALFDKLQQLSLAYFKAQPQGDAIYRLLTDVYGFQTTLNNLVNGVVVSAITLIAMAWIMFSMNWRLTLLALTVTPLIWAHRYFHGVLKRKWTEVKQIDTALTTTIQRSVATMGLVQAFGQEEREYDRFERTVRSSIARYVRTHWSEIAYGLAVGLILGTGAALIFGYGGYLVYRDQGAALAGGQGGMTTGKLLVFITYLAQLYGPLSNLTAAGASMTQGVVGCQRVFDVLDRDPVIYDAPGAVALPKEPRVLQLDRLSFDYLPGTPIVRDISATISPGEMVAFVGPSGVGKSTLLSLLPRFYDPTGGAIRLDGIDIRNVKVRDLRRHIAIVLQENVILSATVAENIAYGRPDATDAQVEHAAKLAEADTFIRALPQGYATEINEQGSNLSGGQRQRIAIARALITEAPVMILDEPTSALDPNNERAITHTLNGLKGRRTIIVVSHRLSTVVACDQIFMMHAGEIVERGTHEELVARRGAYYAMARHQLQLDGAPSDPAPA